MEIKKSKIKNWQNGYTIIETMISVSLFIIVIMSGMGALLNANLLSQRSQGTRTIMDNLSFVSEDISRNLRNGYSYQCFRNGIDLTLSPASLGSPRSCTSGWAVAFETTEGDKLTFSDQWVYYVSSDGKIFKSTDGAQSFIQLTPNEIMVNSTSGFSILGAESSSFPNTQQPLVTLRLIGSITIKNVITPFFLQTSVSQRLLDI